MFCVCKFVLGLILWSFLLLLFFENLWFNDVCVEKIVDRLKFVLAMMLSFVVDWA